MSSQDQVELSHARFLLTTAPVSVSSEDHGDYLRITLDRIYGEKEFGDVDIHENGSGMRYVSWTEVGKVMEVLVDAYADD